jgi:hypothetical protein
VFCKRLLPSWQGCKNVVSNTHPLHKLSPDAPLKSTVTCWSLWLFSTLYKLPGLTHFSPWLVVVPIATTSKRPGNNHDTVKRGCHTWLCNTSRRNWPRTSNISDLLYLVPGLSPQRKLLAGTLAQQILFSNSMRCSKFYSNVTRSKHNFRDGIWSRDSTICALTTTGK